MRQYWILLFFILISNLPLLELLVLSLTNTFFPEVFSSVVSIVVLVVIGIIIKRVVIVDSWIMLVISAGLTGGVGLIINVFIVLNKNEREYVLGLLKKKLNIA